MSKVNIHAKCDKCGPFQVIRKRGKRKDTNDVVHDLPRSVVCPSCRMWGRIVSIEEIAQ